MPQFSLIRRYTGALQTAALFAGCLQVSPEIPAQVDQARSQTYTLLSTVSEVGLTFHAVDKKGLPVNDLKREELGVYDDGVRQPQFLSFYAHQDGPIRVGIILDTSESMMAGLAKNRAIAMEGSQRVFGREQDEAFVEDFGYSAHIRQPWSTDPVRLVSSIQNGIRASKKSLAGTALFRTLFQTCYSEFGKPDQLHAKFILLFTDGEDNASHIELEAGSQMCQESNTAIYAFEPETGAGYSSGPRNLAELTRQTGGSLFHADDSTEQIDHDLDVIERETRNQYFVSFHPSTLKHDSSFHHLELKGPERVDRIESRSGYYDRKLTQADLRPDGFNL